MNRLMVAIVTLVLCALTAFAMGCSTGNDDEVSGFAESGNYSDNDSDDDDSADGDDLPDDDTPTGDDDDATDDDDDSTPGTDSDTYNVIEKEDLGANWECDEMGCDCYEDYYEFMETAIEWSRPITEEQLREQIEYIDSGKAAQVRDNFTATEFRIKLIEAMNINFLLDGINQRPTTLITTDIIEYEFYIQRNLLIQDPFIGQFRAILLVPRIEGPVPGVLALHGHTSSPENFMGNYLGEEIAESGYAILMIASRCMCGSPWEGQVALDLLIDGHTFLGVRNYEAALGLKILKYLPQVQWDHLGMIGHSGGSSSGNVVVRLQLGLQAYVSDNGSDYLSRTYDTGEFMDDTAPALWYYESKINDFKTSTVPILEAPYGYEGFENQILDFFDKKLLM